jgi:hypothetical protein
MDIMDNFYDRAKFSFSRYDGYYNSVNTKGTFYLTINTFFIGLFLAKIDWLKSTFDVTELTGFFIAIFLLSCFAGIILTLLAINPFLKSGETYGKGKSVLFYGSVADFSCSDFNKAFENITEDSLKEDICTQLHVLATGLKKKYRLLSISGNLILTEFMLLLIIVIMLIINIQK